jgi:hypothetical protein
MNFKDLATWDAFVTAGTGGRPMVYVKLPPLLTDGVVVHDMVMCLPSWETYASPCPAVVRWDVLCDESQNPDTVECHHVRVQAEVVEVL